MKIKTNISFLLSFLVLMLCCNDTYAILYGTFDSEDKYESTVQIMGRKAGKKSKFCSGVLIHPRIVLTAGHCANNAEFVIANKDLESHTKKNKRAKIIKFLTPNTKIDRRGKFEDDKDFGVAILDIDIELSRYPKVVSSESELYSLLLSTNFKIDGTGFGRNEKNEYPRKRLFRSTTFLDLTNDISIPPYENFFYAKMFSYFADSGGGVYIESGGELDLLGMTTGYRLDKQKRPLFSTVIQSYPHRAWLNQNNLDFIDLSQDEITDLVEEYLSQIEPKEKKPIYINLPQIFSDNRLRLDLNQFYLLLNMKKFIPYYVDDFDQKIFISKSICPSSGESCHKFGDSFMNSRVALNTINFSKDNHIDLPTLKDINEKVMPSGYWDYIELKIFNGNHVYGIIKLDLDEVSRGILDIEPTFEMNEAYFEFDIWFERIRNE